jgi:hypothetical protein
VHQFFRPMIFWVWCMSFCEIFFPWWFYKCFWFFFEICKHIARGQAPPLVSCLFVASRLLSLEKQVRGVQPIAIGEVIYWLIAHTLAIKFKDTFAKHCNPH